MDLPLPPRELHPNARASWQAKHRAKSAYRKRCGDDVFLQLQVRPCLHAAAISLVYWTAAGKRGGWKEHDPDNLIAWAKTAIDSLQDAGVLADDRRVRYEHPVQGRDDQRPRLVIVITEA